MAEFNNESHDLLRKLEEFYQNDPDGLETMRNLRKRSSQIEYRRLMCENPAILDLQKAALSRAKAYLPILMHPSGHTDRELIAAEIGLLWAKWFLQALGEDPEKATENLENIIKRHAQHAGLTSKEE